MFECIHRSKRCFKRIIIRESFAANPPKAEKLIEKTADFVSGGKLDPIYVDKDFVLFDGYCTYLIAKTLKTKKFKIKQVREEKALRGAKNE